MAEVADARRLVHGEPDVAVVAVDRGLAGVDADAHARRGRPPASLRRDRPLRRDGRRDRAPGAPEDEEERVALAVDLDALVGGECVAEERRCAV